MPYDTSLTYPFPYKTGDGLTQDEVFTNIEADTIIASTVTTQNLTANNISSVDTSTDQLLITRSTIPRLSIDTTVNTTRIRNLDDAFGMDISVPGTSKFIKLSTDDTQRMIIEDGQIITSTPLISDSTIQGTRLISTIATGTEPLTVNSTTVVTNLNSSLLLGGTWSNPGTIGSTTPSVGTFTNLFSATLNGTTTVTAANDGIVTGPSGSDITYIDRNRAGGRWAFGWNSAPIATSFTRMNIYNNSTHRESLFEIQSRGTGSGVNFIRLLCGVLISHATTNLCTFYPTTSGPASITLQTAAVTPIAQLELCCAVTNIQFSTSSLVGDAIIRNFTGGRVLIQSGSAAAQLIVASTGVTASSLFTSTLNGTGTTTIANDSLWFGPSTQDNMFIDRNIAGGNFIYGYHTPRVAGEHFIQQFYNNSSDRNLLMAVVSRGTSTGTDRIQIACPISSTSTATFTNITASNSGVNQASFYASSNGPTSITIKTAPTTPTAQLEICTAATNIQFSTSSLAGDAIIRNVTGGRILIQSGSGAANLIVGPSTFTYNGINVATITTGTWTPSVFFVTGGLPVPFSGYTNVVGKYCKIGATVSVMFNLQGNCPGSSTQTESIIRIDGLPFPSTAGARSQYPLINSFIGGSNPGFFTNTFGLVRTTPLLDLPSNSSYMDVLRQDDTSNFAVLIIGGGFVSSSFTFSAHFTYLCNDI